LETFWKIFEWVVKENESARGIERRTDKDPELEFVNHNKARGLVHWVTDFKDKAHGALERHEIPASFRVTGEGVILPAPRKTR
jgi:hypothetical protein